VRPLIGISLCLDERGRWRSGRDYLYADRAYGAALEAAGATPVHLATPTSLNIGVSRSLVERLDGLLVPGGDDFPPDDPTSYPSDVFELTPTAQIDFDRSLVDAALAAGKPLLGVCYGMQLLALCCGGTLHPHLPVDIGDAIAHGGGSGTTRHAVTFAAQSRLASAAGIVTGSDVLVNSRHHQGVRDPGSLAVAARSGDGLIEAVEGLGDAFVAGVQWHPETLDGAAGAGLFAAFVAAARS
jgi:putative glutamine amidotransferase